MRFFVFVYISALSGFLCAFLSRLMNGFSLVRQVGFDYVSSGFCENFMLTLAVDHNI